MFLKEHELCLLNIVWKLTFIYSSLPLLAKLSYFEEKVGYMGSRIHTKRKALYTGVLHKDVHHPFTQHILLIKM